MWCIVSKLLWSFILHRKRVINAWNKLQPHNRHPFSDLVGTDWLICIVNHVCSIIVLWNFFLFLTFLAAVRELYIKSWPCCPARSYFSSVPVFSVLELINGWVNGHSSHYSPHQVISLVSKRTRVAEMQFTLFERLLIAMSHEVQLLTSARLIYLRLLIKLTIMPYLSN